MKINFSAVVYKDDDFFVAECPEVGTYACGKCEESAVCKLKEITQLYLEAVNVELKGKPKLKSFTLEYESNIDYFLKSTKTVAHCSLN